MTARNRSERPCRHCGERDWLILNPRYDEEQYAHAADGSLMRDADGTPTFVSVDFMECLICGALAPVHIWNGAPVTPAMRAALIEQYLAEGSAPKAMAA